MISLHSRLRLGVWVLVALPLLGADDYRSIVASEEPALLAVYKDLHAHPELSYREERTSVLLAGELRKAGYTVTEHVGKYPNGRPAYGIVAILKNGAGPTVLLRTDMDALPVEEKQDCRTPARFAPRTTAVRQSESCTPADMTFTWHVFWEQPARLRTSRIAGMAR